MAAMDSTAVGPLNAYESETLIESLTTFSVAEIGTQKWFKQHEALEKLNIQAHYNVQNQSEEFVTEALVTFDMMRTLVHDLLVTETWKRFVFPLVVKKISPESELKAYMMLYHEATVLNLLEIVLYNKRACVAIGDAILDLVDYCARKMTILNGWEHIDDTSSKETKTPQQVLETLKHEQQLETQRRDLDFMTSVTSLSIFRYITDHITDIPLSAMTRILNTNDMIVQLAHLMEQAPWLKTVARKDGVTKLMRFEGVNWKEISQDDLMEVSKVEGQVWLALYNLLVEPECRRKYEYHEHNHAMVLRLKEFMSDTLKDQIPILVDLHRSLEELALITPAKDPSVIKRSMVIELVPELLDSITKNQNWETIATQQLKTIFTNNAQDRMNIAKVLADMYDLNTLEPLLDDPVCTVCGQVAMQRCSRCKTEWYCSRPCQVKNWKTHKPMCDMFVAVAGLELEDKKKGSGAVVSKKSGNGAVQSGKIVEIN